ncbi:efflux transporter outer membrane subunit [Rhodocyclus gracilis]|uniref:Efflux transporter outer membrane subunit n=1 Tax=Rhodocyclus tenuis TaxID=1066 RepID=A0A6L5JSU7_RHOTE|nr:TolC family protein [Rhodocyclus gracilis]MQY50216.1 efflux transporter outer membrane subunit [Rhodocyclus gracilis]
MRERRLVPLAAIAPTLLLGACAVGPHYVAPPLPASAAQPFISAGATASAAPLPERWWRLYDDPVLDALVQRAFAANTDLRIATANLERERAVLAAAAVARLPATQLSAARTDGDNTSSSGNGSVLPQRQWTTSGGLAVAWEVDLAGRVRRLVDAANADVEAVAAARDGVRVAVAADTTRQYLVVCTLAESVAAAQESIAVAQQTLALSEQRERAGAAARLEVERAAVIRANAAAALPPLAARRHNALLALAALLGGTPADIPPAAAACAKAPPLAAPIPAGDGADLLRRRPDIRQAERRLAADTARIGVATADLYPRISLAGAGSYAQRAGQSNDSWSFGVGPLLSWSFPNISATRARIGQSEAQSRASLAAFDGSVVNALREAEQALSSLDAEQQRQNRLAEAERHARSAYALAEARYRAGNVSQLELLDASREEIAARSTRLESAVALNGARIDVFRALGGGWESDSAAPSTHPSTP